MTWRAAAVLAGGMLLAPEARAQVQQRIPDPDRKSVV